MFLLFAVKQNRQISTFRCCCCRWISRATNICGRWLGLCRYADIDIGLAALVKVLRSQTSWQTKGLARSAGRCQDSQDLWSAKTLVLADLRIFTKSSHRTLAIFGENSRKI